jgi:glycogen debranching enzyme
VHVRPGQISILEGSTFIVSKENGDIDAAMDATDGLFYRDTRHLSRWDLRINGRELAALSAEVIEYDEVFFFLIEPTGSMYRNPSLSVVRRRHVGEGMQEQIEVTNHGLAPMQVELSLLFAADFADIFEIKDKLMKIGELSRRSAEGRAVLAYQREDFRRETTIRARDAFFTDQSLTFRLTLAPRETWNGDIEVSVATDHDRPVPKRQRHQPNMPDSLDEWLAAVPHLATDSDDLRRIYHRSLVDLAALRFYPETVPDSSLPAAGLPWFMALFGRDSLITSYQALPFVPELARTTLRALGAQQATDFDDFRDAEPGKILHELRHGELTHFGERPQSPYFGSVDSTPLFLVVLDEYERWTGDVATVRDLEPAARAALEWIERHGDLNGDGYLDYQTRNPSTGLANQCWKDSWNSIVHPDGRLASLPRSVVEVQGYAYDARVRLARLARTVYDDVALADRLERDAKAFKERFTVDFWLPDKGFYALALDGDRRPVPTLSSNVGHLLWSGLVAEEHVEQVVRQLLGPQMFTGWGVRTLAAGQPVYNPIEYHNGTVWPHDTALIAAGLARYGRREEAGRLALALLQAAGHFAYRLPEVFVGYDRAATAGPVAYPTACSPQAWASGAPLLLLRTVLGLEPDGEVLSSDPAVPGEIGRLALHGIPGRWGRADAIGGYQH